MTQAEENALRIYIAKLEKENIEMRQLATTTGFYNAYFKALKDVKSYKDAFDEVNERYCKLFGKYRYSDYSSFKRMINYYNTKK